MFTPIELDKTRNLRYGMKAISLIEKKLNVCITKLDFNNLTMEQLATFIWGGLYHEDPNLSVEKVMDLIDEHSSIPEAVSVVGKAISEAFPEQKNAQRAKK